MQVVWKICSQSLLCKSIYVWLEYKKRIRIWNYMKFASYHWIHIFKIGIHNYYSFHAERNYWFSYKILFSRIIPILLQPICNTFTLSCVLTKVFRKLPRRQNIFTQTQTRVSFSGSMVFKCCTVVICMLKEYVSMLVLASGDWNCLVHLCNLRCKTWEKIYKLKLFSCRAIHIEQL